MFNIIYFQFFFLNKYINEKLNLQILDFKKNLADIHKIWNTTWKLIFRFNFDSILVHERVFKPQKYSVGPWVVSNLIWYIRVY